MQDGMVSDLYESDTGYKTCDLYLAAFFQAVGCKMISSDRDPKNRRIHFVFEKNPLIQELKVKYFRREAKVDALTFADNVKSLKSLCHNILNGPYKA